MTKIVDWNGNEVEVNLDAAETRLGEHAEEEYPGWPMKLHGPDGKPCGCELQPDGSEASMLIALAEHSLFGKCPNAEETP